MASDEFEERRRAVAAGLSERRLDGFLAAFSPNLRYLSGFTGKVGDLIIVKAHDDFRVTKVELNLTDVDNQEMESGPAVETPTGSGRWVYAIKVWNDPGVLIHVNVTVSDLPGSLSVKTLDKTL